MRKTPLLLATLLAIPFAFADDEASSKKGVCMSGKAGDPSELTKRISALQVGWHYNWTGEWKGKEIEGAPFVPMVWGNNKWSLDPIKSHRVSESKMASSPLLTFNEPDKKDQSNMTVEQALALWPTLEKTNRRLGSPVTVHADNEWMQSFIKQADAKNHRVDFICVHWYGQNDPDKFISQLKRIHEMYKKPIWVTEFAIADWSAKSLKDNKQSPEDVVRFLKKALPALDKLDFVERYAWFNSLPGDPKLGNSALFDESGNLTKVGEFYAAHTK